MQEMSHEFIYWVGYVEEQNELDTLEEGSKYLCT